jgi:hypothetical protein
MMNSNTRDAPDQEITRPLMSRMNMYRPKFPISIRNNKMSPVTHYYGLLPLPLCFFGDCSGSYSITRRDSWRLIHSL